MGAIAGLGVLGLFFGAGFTPLPNVLAKRLVVPSRLETADAIVVLGGGIQDARTLSPASLRRTIQGIRLYRRGMAPVLIFSGGAAGQQTAEASVMASLAEELGIPGTAIWTETRSNDTWSEAREVARLARPKGVRRILLVTDPFHMRRASRAFERAGFEVRAAADESVSVAVHHPEDRLNLTRRVAYEVLAGLYYRVRDRF